MVEFDISTLILNNLIGVLFGLLMYKMATTTIKENTKAINELKDAINNRKL